MSATPITLAALAARSSEGYSSAIDCNDFGTVRLTLNVTANSVQPTNPFYGGTSQQLPSDASTFQIRVETSADSTTWRELSCTFEGANRPQTRFTPGPAIRSERKVFVGMDRYLRAHWIIGHGAPVTFSVDGTTV